MVSGVNAANAVQASAKSVTAAKKASSGFSQVLKNTMEKTDNTKEAKSLDEIFSEASSKYNVPVKLLKAVAKAESGFQADAVSSCGAQGIMQLMPSTAASLGVKNSFDPEQNIMGGAKYLSELLSSFNGDAKLAVAAYNAGSGSVRKYGGVPPYAETQNYVKKVLGYAGEDISAVGWNSGSVSGAVNDSDSDTSVNDITESLGLGDLSFGENDYQLFAKLYVQRLEQNALNIASENAVDKEKHFA